MENPVLAIIITVSDLAIFLLAGWLAKISEAKGWNGGYCKECGHRWETFDMDSQGGRGYICKDHHFFWASYKVDIYKA